MPLCTIHLLSLHKTSLNPLPTFLSTIHSTKTSPLVISRVIRWIILPSVISTDHLLARNISWDILLILPSDTLHPQLANLVAHHWSITAGVPSRLVSDFSEKNNKLLHTSSNSVPAPRNARPAKHTASAQGLELSAELDAWIQAFSRSAEKRATAPVSMFNLLAFRPGMKAEYLRYGAAFASSVGAAHGGNAKIVGSVTHGGGAEGREGAEQWDEVALAQYPSILHFRDMLLDEEYQAVNQRHRVPSLKDTCILMTSEIGVEEGRGVGAKL